MPDLIIKLKILSAKVPVFSPKFLAAEPNKEKIDDPKWVDKEDGTRCPKIAKYTDKQWVNEVFKRYGIAIVRKGAKKLATDALQRDNEIIEIT